MTLRITSLLLAICPWAGATAETNDKPSPVHYKSSTAPLRRSQTAAVAQESSRNRLQGSVMAPLAEPEKMVNGIQAGTACFYGVKPLDTDDGKPQPDSADLSAAHASLPFGSQVQVTNLINGRSIRVTITDRIPIEGDRIISVNRRAAERLGFVSAGTARVKLEVVRESSRS